MLALALLLAVAATPETDALGRQLAETGTLASLLPMIARKETGELLARHPELSAAEQAQLKAIADRTFAAGKAKLMAAIGHAYAERLTADELKALAAFNASPLAARYRAVQPQAVAAAMGAMQGMDFKRDIAAAFCAQTGKLCDSAR